MKPRDAFNLIFPFLIITIFMASVFLGLETEYLKGKVAGMNESICYMETQASNCFGNDSRSPYLENFYLVFAPFFIALLWTFDRHVLNLNKKEKNTGDTK